MVGGNTSSVVAAAQSTTHPRQARSLRGLGVDRMTTSELSGRMRLGHGSVAFVEVALPAGLIDPEWIGVDECKLQKPWRDFRDF